jgi:hypothetical protein
MDGSQPSGILSVMINPDALPQNKEQILARWAALYPEAFALAAAANLKTGLRLRRLNKTRPNLADLNSPPIALQPFHIIRLGVISSFTPRPRRKGNDAFSTTTRLETKGHV